MTTITLPVPVNPKAMTVAGWALSGLFIAFMVFDTGIKLAQLPIVAETNGALGYPPEAGLTIGVIEAICLALYVIPRTSVLGAILFTGVMGGAIATHLRVESPLVSHTLFGVYLGLFCWGGLWLRDERLRALVPVKR
jgi:hypothetical protein